MSLHGLGPGTLIRIYEGLKKGQTHVEKGWDQVVSALRRRNYSTLEAQFVFIIYIWTGKWDYCTTDKQGYCA